MKLARVSHRRPLYDPDWLSGSLFTTLPLFGGAGIFLAFLLRSSEGRFDFTRWLIASGAILLAMVIAAWNTMKKRRDRMLARSSWPPLGFEPVNDQALTECARLGCQGDEVELIGLVDRIPRAPSHFVTAPYTRFVFLWLLLAWTLLSWVAVLYLRLSTTVMLGALLLILFAALSWRALFGVRYEVSPGRLRVIGCGLLSSRMGKNIKVDLGAARITCLFQYGTVHIEPKGARSLSIPLDGIMRRHAFVEALFWAANVPSNEAAVSDAPVP